MDNKLITVTSPLLPNLEYFTAELQKIWDSKWITNMGQYTNNSKMLWPNISMYLMFASLQMVRFP